MNTDNINLGDIVLFKNLNVASSALVISRNINSLVILETNDLACGKYIPKTISNYNISKILYHIDLGEALHEKVINCYKHYWKRIILENSNVGSSPVFISMLVDDNELNDIDSIKKKIQNATFEYFNTNVDKESLSSAKEFNYKDFKQLIPNYICEKYGFYIEKFAEVMDCDPIASIDFNKNIMDEIELEGDYEHELG